MTEENKQLEQEKITVKVALAGKTVTFHLRMISMAEETALRQRYAGLSDFKDEDRIKKEFEINVDALQAFSLQKAEILVNGNENVTQHFDFIDQTPFKERVAEYAVRGFLNKLTPDVSFL